jgi:hypothetical protein
VSPFRPFLLPQPRVCSRNRRLLPSYAPRGVNISPILSTLRILPVTTGVYPIPFRFSPIPEPSSISFIINTCKSVSKQTTSTPFRVNHLCKNGRGEGLLLTALDGSDLQTFRRECVLCLGLPRPGRRGKPHVLSSLPPLCRSWRSFFAPPPFVFNSLRPLLAKYRGGYPDCSRRSDAPFASRMYLRDVQTFTRGCASAAARSRHRSHGGVARRQRRSWGKMRNRPKLWKTLPFQAVVLGAVWPRECLSNG